MTAHCDSQIANDRRSRHSLHRLVGCVRALGWRLGWKYWRIQNKASVNPWIALQWAESCERKADELRDTAPELSAAHRDWARQLRAAHESYKWGKAPNMSMSGATNKYGQQVEPPLDPPDYEPVECPECGYTPCICNEDTYARAT